MKNKKWLLVILIFCFLSAGCFNEKINKTDYNLAELLNKAKWKKEKNVYVKTDISDNKYIFYFDNTNYENNYFSIIINEEEIKYYYAKDYLVSNKCEIEYNDLEKNNQYCSEQEISNYKRLLMSFDIMTSEIGITKEDLYILESEIDEKFIHIDID